ncbi:MAG: tail fiber domain-containing protein, partial [Bacteroidetes bacterium]|nr:tail fiber domain-containing protein [Bacteroidota bacterium]
LNANVFFGQGAGKSSTGIQNIGLGTAALTSNSTGSLNTAVGFAALQNNSSGGSNTAVGRFAMINSNGSDNTGVGQITLVSNTTGSNNSAFGSAALQSNTVGSNNTGIGYGADVSANNLTNATAIGYNAKVGASNSLVLGGTGPEAVKVGIGLTTPSATLDIAGTIKIADGSQAAGKVLTSDANGLATWSNNSGWSITGNTGTNPTTHFIGTTDAKDLVFRTNNTEFARLTSAGNLGIGTSTPNAFLEVQNTNTSGNAGNFNVSNAANNGSAVLANKNGTSGAAFQAIVTGGAEGLNINQNGTGYALDVIVSNVSSVNSAIIASHNGKGPAITANAQGTGGVASFAITNAGSVATALSVATVGSGPAAIFNGGNVGIGGTPSERLDVVGNVKFSGALMPNNVPGTAGQVLTSAGAGLPPTWSTNSGWGLSGNAGTVGGTDFIGTTDNQPLIFKTDGAERIRIDGSSGDATFGARITSPQDASFNLVTVGRGSGATAPQQNTAVGISSQEGAVTGSNNTTLGFFTLAGGTSGGNNTAVGSNSMRASTTGSNNTGVGAGAIGRGTGDGNTAIGSGSLTRMGTGSGNTALGANAGYSALQADGNDNNTLVGFGAGQEIVGSNNTLIGYQTNLSAAGFTNATAIGYTTVVNASNKVRIGNTSVTVIEGQVSFTAASDRRFKKDIQPIEEGVEFIKKLKPVSYQLKLDATGKTNWGFIAQDIEALIGTQNAVLTVGGDSARSLGLRYTDFVAPLVRAVQEQQNRIEILEAKIKQLNEDNNLLKSNLESRLQAMEEMLQVKAKKPSRLFRKSAKKQKFSNEVSPAVTQMNNPPECN